MLQDVQSLRVSCHQAIFDPVVYHFHKMSGPGRPAVQVTIFRRALCLSPSWRARDNTSSRRQSAENRVEMTDDLAMRVKQRREAPPDLRICLDD